MEKRGDYLAFLSYSHRDRKVANWLHRALEFYALPAHLVGQDSRLGPIPRRVRPIFRDREELAAAENLGKRLEAALQGSRTMIVLCSPAAVASRWTNEEIATFKRLNPGAPVLAAIIDGEPFASEIEGREDEECFPPALRFKLAPDGTLTDERAEPIAADLREEGDGQRLGKLKLVAGLFGLGLDDLVQRDAARRNKRLAWIAAGSALGMVGTTGLSLYAIDQREEAIEQREQADGLVEFMLTDLREKLEPVGRLDVLESVGDRALDYYAQQKLADLDADALGRRSRALLLMGEVSLLRGEAADALDVFRDAAATTELLLERDPDDWQRIYDHAQSVFWVGYVADEQGRASEALAGFIEYRDLTARLVELKPADRVSQLEASYGPINLGYAYRKQGRLDDALAAFEVAQQRLVRIEPPDRDTVLTLVQTYAHAATLHQNAGRLTESIAARRAQLETLGDPLLDSNDAAVRESRGYGYANLANALLTIGDLAAARDALAQSNRIFVDLSALEPGNAEWREVRASNLSDQAMIDLAERDRAAAHQAVGAAITELQGLRGSDPDNSSIARELLEAYAVAALTGVAIDVGAARELVTEVVNKTDSEDTASVRHHAAVLLIALGDRASRVPERQQLYRQAEAIVSAADSAHPLLSIQQARIAKRLGKTPPRTAPGLDPDSAFGGLYRD